MEQDLELHEIIDFVDRDERGLETPLAPLVDLDGEVEEVIVRVVEKEVRVRVEVQLDSGNREPEMGGEDAVLALKDRMEKQAGIVDSLVAIRDVEVARSEEQIAHHPHDRQSTPLPLDGQLDDTDQAPPAEEDIVEREIGMVEAQIPEERLGQNSLPRQLSPIPLESTEESKRIPITSDAATEEEQEAEVESLFLGKRLVEDIELPAGASGEACVTSGVIVEEPLVEEELEQPEMGAGTNIEEVLDPIRKNLQEPSAVTNDPVIEEEVEPARTNEEEGPRLGSPKSLDATELENAEDPLGEVYDSVLEVLELLVDLVEEISVEGEGDESGADDGMEEGHDVPPEVEEDRVYGHRMASGSKSHLRNPGTLSPIDSNPDNRPHGESRISNPNTASRNSSSPLPLRKPIKRRRSQTIESESEDEIALVPTPACFVKHPRWDGTIHRPTSSPRPRGRSISRTTPKRAKRNGRPSDDFPFSPSTPSTKTYLHRRKPHRSASQSSSSPINAKSITADDFSDRSTRERSSRPSRNARRSSDWWVLPSSVPESAVRSKSQNGKRKVDWSSGVEDEESGAGGSSDEEDVGGGSSVVRRKGSVKKLQKW